VLIICSDISCDRITKHIVRQKMDYHEQISVLDHYVTLVRVENKGAFLSMGNSLPKPVNVILLTILPVIVLGFALYYLFTKTNLTRLVIAGICLIIGGGIGNLYDRIVFGSVTDFMHIDFVLFQTGIFNVADMSIMAGMFLVLFDVFVSRKKSDATVSG
jgi:signal peptidase II